jgi:hypothetical protein
VPAELADEVEARRAEVVERVSEVRMMKFQDAMSEVLLQQQQQQQLNLAAAAATATAAKFSCCCCC